ncbi:MAG: TonB-dependent receptor, partial [Proteobacteria bacterium]|nr:TonB-dependent receptor [Pseudomonadota bacterium]
HDHHSVWTAVSRAIRTPARSNDDIHMSIAILPGNMLMAIFGDKDFDSEKLIAYELGYRFEPKGHLSIDIAAFYNTYDNLITYEAGVPFMEFSPSPHLVIPLIMDNKMDGNTYGVEVATKWDIMDKWRLSAGYTFLQIQLHADSSSSATDPEAAEGNSPHNQFRLQSYMSLPYGFEFDQMLYYVDNIENQDVDKYIRIDLRLGWKPSDNIELAVIGQNLFDPQHPEYTSSSGGITTTEVERSVYGKITWKF